jgi:hypothetical protein
MAEELRRLLSLSDAFEEHIRRIDRLPNAEGEEVLIVLPSDSSIRHALRDGVRAHLAKDTDGLLRALKNAEAAIQETYVFEMTLLVERFDFFQQKWKDVVISDAAPSYEAKCIFFRQLQKQITDHSSKISPLSHSCTTDLDLAQKYLGELSSIEEELLKKRKDKRSNLVLAIVIGVGSIIAIVLFGTWDNVYKFYHRDPVAVQGTTTQPAPIGSPTVDKKLSK